MWFILSQCLSCPTWTSWLASISKAWPHIETRCEFLTQRFICLHCQYQHITSEQHDSFRLIPTLPTPVYNDVQLYKFTMWHFANRLTWDQYEIQILRISWVQRGSDRASTHLRIYRSCLKEEIKRCKVCHLNTFICLYRHHRVRYLSGANDLYLSPACLKLFSFSMTVCITNKASIITSHYKNSHSFN